MVPCTARRYTIEGLTHMGRDLGILSPVEFAVSCEAKQDMFRQARRGQTLTPSRIPTLAKALIPTLPKPEPQR